MSWLSVVGLALDLIGVILLGVDLLKVQLAQKASAEADERSLNEAFPKFQTLEFEQTYLETGIAGGGEFDGDGGVDVSALSQTLKSFRREIENSSDGATNILEYLFSSAHKKADEARRSLAFTYFGLFLIVVGFALQFTGAIAGHPNLLGAR